MLHIYTYTYRESQKAREPSEDPVYFVYLYKGVNTSWTGSVIAPPVDAEGGVGLRLPGRC